jgi:hypothetical protein
MLLFTLLKMNMRRYLNLQIRHVISLTIRGGGEAFGFVWFLGLGKEKKDVRYLRSCLKTVKD